MQTIHEDLAMLFKIYEGETALFFHSITELAAFCEVSTKEARKAFYQNVAVLNGREVINYSRK
jgi:hypothetical protein